MTSNRGLAGGYNNNVVKLLAENGLSSENVQVYGVGKKGVDTLAHRGYRIVADESDIINEPLFSDAIIMGKTVLDAYEAGEIGEIYLAYTNFKNTVVQEPRLLKLLPIETEDETEEEDGKAGQNQAANSGQDGHDSGSGKSAPMNYEPEAEEALNLLIPKYLNSIIFGAFIEAVASENGARMQAMDAATSNAEDMISALSLAYNRARQGAITQELTEIISGAEALN